MSCSLERVYLLPLKANPDSGPLMLYASTVGSKCGTSAGSNANFEWIRRLDAVTRVQNASIVYTDVPLCLEFGNHGSTVSHRADDRIVASYSNLQYSPTVEYSENFWTGNSWTEYNWNKGTIHSVFKRYLPTPNKKGCRNRSQIHAMDRVLLHTMKIFMTEWISLLMGAELQGCLQ